jgi:hypothetical protein
MVSRPPAVVTTKCRKSEGRAGRSRSRETTVLGWSASGEPEGETEEGMNYVSGALPDRFGRGARGKRGEDVQPRKPYNITGSDGLRQFSA